MRKAPEKMHCTKVSIEQLSAQALQKLLISNIGADEVD